MLDCHCHVLPGIDDGAPDLETGLRMLAAMHAGGVTSVVATPHWLNPLFQVETAAVEAAFAQLQEATARQLPELRLHLGAENHFAGTIQNEHFIERMRPMGDSRLVLVELPDGHLPPGTWSTLFRLHVSGWRPMLAHVERCRPLAGAVYLGELRRFTAAGGLIQITLGSALRRHGWRVWLRAKRLLRLFPDNCILASDAHDLRVRQPRWQDLPRSLRPFTRADLASV